MIYYVDSYSSWTLIRAQNKKAAKSAGSSYFGRGLVKSVRKATPKRSSTLQRSWAGPLKGNDMNWTKLNAILQRDYPSLYALIQRRIPAGYIFKSGIDQDPPSIVVMFGKHNEAGRIHPLLGPISRELNEGDVQALEHMFLEVLQSFPGYEVKKKITEGILAFKLSRS